MADALRSFSKLIEIAEAICADAPQLHGTAYQLDDKLMNRLALAAVRARAALQAEQKETTT